jgi:hypothetical protein
MPETKISYDASQGVNYSKGTGKTKPCISGRSKFSTYISASHNKFHGPKVTDANKLILYAVYGQ